MQKKINQLKILFKDILAFIKLKFYVHPKNEKALLVSLENPQLYHRFAYLLLKFYQLAGYNIYYPMDFSLFRNLRNKDHYLGLIMREKNFLAINKKNIAENFVEIKDEMFSPDYFKNYFENNNQEANAFHIPMSCHPFMYHYEIWNREININKTRHNAIFSYGNFDSEAYLGIKKTQFQVLTRLDLLNFFKTKTDFVNIKNKEEVNSENASLDRKYVFAIKEDYRIEMEDIRELLSCFNFYLCCSGVVMPLCHNVIEAMSVGTIPLIEKGYSDVMYPNLENGVNAIIFDDLNHLDHLLSDELFNINETKISEIRENVLSYYHNFLSPKNAVENLNKSIANKNLIYLQAEHRSVKFF